MNNNSNHVDNDAAPQVEGEVKHIKNDRDPYFSSEFADDDGKVQDTQNPDSSEDSKDSDNSETPNNPDDNEDRDNLNISNESTQEDGLAPINIEKESSSRLLGTGKIRLTLIASGVGVLCLGLLGYGIFSSVSAPPVEPVRGEVAVPKTRIGAAAIVNEEQAAHIKEQQAIASEQAEKNGQSYLPPIVTVGNQETEELAAPTQPGLKGPVISNERTFKDSEGRVYTADQAANLQMQGVRINGVTEGKGSIVDPTINNAARNSQANTTGAINDKSPAKSNNTPAYEPYTVKPYSPSTTAKSELVTDESALLEKSAKETEDWQNQYLELRLKKARLVSQTAQVAFQEQVKDLELTVKPSKDSRESLGAFGRTYYPTAAATTKTEIPTSQEKTNANAGEVFKPVIYAGETYRAILKNEVNTDHGSEVIATMQSGPLKGSTLIGSVVKTNENIQFNFNRLLRKGKSEINISALGRQIGTNSSGMADDINKHYLVRYSALVASSALSGVGNSYEQTSGANATVTGSGTVVTSSTDPTKERIIGNALGELGGEVSSEVKNLTKKPTTYITHSGKVFNVFFNQNVLDGVATDAQKNN